MTTKGRNPTFVADEPQRCAKCGRVIDYAVTVSISLGTFGPVNVQLCDGCAELYGSTADCFYDDEEDGGVYYERT